MIEIVEHQTPWGVLSALATDYYMGKDGGRYAEDELRFIRSLLRPEWTCLQAGGNVGLFALAIAPKVRKLFVAEPQGKLFELLEKNLRANGIENVVALRGALGEVSETVCGPEIDYEKDGDFCGVGLRGEGKAFPLVTIDEWTSGEKLDFIQLDIEGMELEALRGGTHQLVFSRPLLLFEDNFAEPAKRSELVDFLTSYDYSMRSAPNNAILALPRGTTLCQL